MLRGLRVPEFVTFMMLANLYLLAWDFDRLKSVLPFKQASMGKATSTRFPFIFFAGVIASLAAVVLINQYLFSIRPGNSELECRNGCKAEGNKNLQQACQVFCSCIYTKAQPLDSCVAQYNRAKAKARGTKTTR